MVGGAVNGKCVRLSNDAEQAFADRRAKIMEWPVARIEALSRGFARQERPGAARRPECAQTRSERVRERG